MLEIPFFCGGSLLIRCVWSGANLIKIEYFELFHHDGDQFLVHSWSIPFLFIFDPFFDPGQLGSQFFVKCLYWS